MAELQAKNSTLETEVQADWIMACASSVLIIFLVFYYLMVWAHVVEPNNHIWTYHTLFIFVLILTISIVVYALSREGAPWIRYVLMFSVISASLEIAVLMGGVYLIFVLPLILCIPYYDKLFATSVAVICGAFILLEPTLSCFAGIIDYNYVEFNGQEDGSVIMVGAGMDAAMTKTLQYSLPSFLLFISVTLLTIWLVNIGYSNAVKYHEVSMKEAAVQKELSIASDIQMGMLPEDITDDDNYSIAAKMLPAKVVGGDFYDFFKVDDTHVALLIADVSGKGMPASLFMASAKASLRTNLANGLQPDMVMKKTNSVLCDSNREKLFVTAWLGLIDLEDGRLSFVNAGHNPPFLIHEGKVEKLEEAPNFVLGRKRRVNYVEHRRTLKPGDILFMYTDGVTEAVGPNSSMYGEDRLRNALSTARGSLNDILTLINDDIKAFTADVERSDDLTMVFFEMNGYLEEDVEFKDFILNKDSYNDVQAYIRTKLEASGCPENVIRDIEICSSEILANIDMYAYQGNGGGLGISVNLADRKAKVIFRDRGPEYNPLLKDNPDIEKRIKDHKIGGFGLFIVRKMMDEVTYSRKDDCNILTIKRGY